MPPEPAAASRSSILSGIVKAIPSVLVLGVLGAGWLAVHHMGTEPEQHAEEVAAAPEEEPMNTILTLPAGKLNTAEFVVAPVQEHSIQHTHVVPGRVTYDQTKHVDVRTPIDGILQSMLVQPGDTVVKGELLATIASPQIGEARAELMHREAQEGLSAARAERAKEVSDNLKRLVAMLEDKAKISDLEKEFQGQALGNYRQKLQPAYANLLLARDLLGNIEPLVGTGAIPERTVRERQTNVQIALAEYEAARDQATFDARQAEKEAAAELANSQRQTEVARQVLHALVGTENPMFAGTDEETISVLEIRAPMNGTVESRNLAANERIYRADKIFTLADTSSLYVSADIREKDWPAVSIAGGTEIEIAVPALEERKFSAVVQYVGREVGAGTNSVPVVAKLKNPNGLMRPGMFARVSLPIGDPRNVLAVRPESIVHHDDKSFVFVAIDDYKFQCVPVTTGLESEEWIEIRDGLRLGQPVVQKNAFLLKSEWLLEGE